MQYKEFHSQKITEDTIGTAPACVGTTSCISKSTLLGLPTRIALEFGFHQ